MSAFTKARAALSTGWHGYVPERSEVVGLVVVVLALVVLAVQP